MGKVLFQFLVFPGFLFLAIAGGLLSWFDRKITARVQFRKGPPLLQPFYDFIKLLAKETVVPENTSPVVFMLAPVIALSASVIAGILILMPVFGISSGFKGDLIVIIYLLTIPAISLIFGGAVSGNPLSSVGASREIKLLISYELPFLLAIISLVIKADLSIKLEDIIYEQHLFGAFIGSISGILAFIVAMMSIQAKLGKVPFDLAEAETEIIAGAYTEYSGTALAMFKLNQYVLLFVLPAFVATLFFGKFKFDGWNILWTVLKLLAVVLLVTLIRNTNPRVRIKSAMRFFLVWMNLFAVLSVILAIVGY